MYKHEKKKPEQDHRQDHERELAGPFFAVLFLLTLVAFLIPLRPETSLRERRKLREFPQFSVQTLLSGDYFDDITAWFSDTFPGREKMLEVADRIDSLHGLMRYEVAMTDSNTTDDSAELDALLEEAEAAAAAEVEPAAPKKETQKTSEKSVSYSTNSSSTVKEGNRGVYSYKSRGGSYESYYIIDFDEGYV